MCRLLGLPSPAVLQHLDELLVCITGEGRGGVVVVSGTWCSLPAACAHQWPSMKACAVSSDAPRRKADLMLPPLCYAGVWSEVEGGSDAGVRGEYGLEYSWTAGDDGTIELTVASSSEDAEGECMRRRLVRGGLVCTCWLVGEGEEVEGGQAGTVLRPETCLALYPPAPTCMAVSPTCMTVPPPVLPPLLVRMPPGSLSDPPPPLASPPLL